MMGMPTAPIDEHREHPAYRVPRRYYIVLVLLLVGGLLEVLKILAALKGS